MNNEYIIINKSQIEKRIEELENTDTASWEYQLGQIKELKEILSQSTPLIPEIEKAYTAGESSRYSRIGEAVLKQNYISNLKLDI